MEIILGREDLLRYQCNKPSELVNVSDFKKESLSYEDYLKADYVALVDGDVTYVLKDRGKKRPVVEKLSQKQNKFFEQVVIPAIIKLKN
jgi:hypothetical protein